VGSENLAHNIDHFNTFTDYRLTQVLRLAGLERVRLDPLKLYVFWMNPLNNLELTATTLLSLFFRAHTPFTGNPLRSQPRRLR